MSPSACGPALWVLAAALAGCAAAPVGPARDDQLDALTASAEAAYGRGLTPQAERLYARALDRARTLDDPAEAADAAFNLALCRLELGRLDDAGPALDEARAWADRLGARGDDIDLARAELDAVQGRADEAARRADDLLARTPRLPADLRVQALALRGLLLAPSAASVADLAEAESMIGAGVEPGAASRVAYLRARLASDPAEQAAAFDEQARLLRLAGRAEPMARALADATRALADAGDRAAALDRGCRAAAAWLGLGDAPAARRFIQQTLAPLADGATDRDRALVRALADEAAARAERDP